MEFKNYIATKNKQGNVYLEDKNLEGDKYHRSPTEIHARLMEIRYFLNKKPGLIITPQEYQRAKDNLKEPNGDKRDIKDYKDEDMLHWLNTIANNNTINNNLI